jgi:hypothetical protein
LIAWWWEKKAEGNELVARLSFVCFREAVDSFASRMKAQAQRHQVNGMILVCVLSFACGSCTTRSEPKLTPTVILDERMKGEGSKKNSPERK